MENRNQDYISEVRAANRAIWDGINKLKSLQREWQALDYGSTFANTKQEGENAGYMKEAVGGVVFDTADALSSLLDSGHATNMARLL